MKNSPISNVRVVRCPRCTKLLPEPADVPLYLCGGCGTTLQAKYYKNADERRQTGSEGSGGGEAGSSSLRCSWDQNEGINESSVQDGNIVRFGVSNFSNEASSSNQPNQQPPPSPDQHFPHRDGEREPNPEVTNALREDYSVNEPSPLNHDQPSNLALESGEVQGGCISVEQHGKCKSSFSNEPMEQAVQLTPNGEVKQEEITVEQLESADSSNEDASSEGATETEEKTLSNNEADELNQNVSINCRLEQNGEVSCSREVLPSNEPSLLKTNNSSLLAAQRRKVEESCTKVNEEQLVVSNFSNQPPLEKEPTVGEKLSSPLGSPNGEAVMRDQNTLGNHREEQPGFGIKYRSEVSSTNEHVFILKRNDSSSQFLTLNQEGEGDSADKFCSREQLGGMSSNIVTSSNDSMILQDRESQMMNEKQEMDEATHQDELGECEENQIVDNLPSKINSPAVVNSRKTDESALGIPEAEKGAGLDLSFKAKVSTAPDEVGKGESEQSFKANTPADGNSRVPASPTSKAVTESELVTLAMDKLGGMYSNMATSSNESLFLQNREISIWLTENQEMDEGRVQSELPECKQNQITDNLPVEINSWKTDESASVIPEAGKRAGLDLSFKPESSIAPVEHGNRESEQSFEADAPADGNNSFPATATSKALIEAEAVTESAVINALLPVGTSYRDLPKSPTGNSFAYDGSVSSCDGNDDQVVDQIASETMQGTNVAENPVADDKMSMVNTTYCGSSFQHQTDNPPAISGRDSFHSAELGTPVVLDEIKMSDSPRHDPYRRTGMRPRMRPRTWGFLPSIPLYRRSSEMSYESSSHASLAHEEFYDLPDHYPPYRSRDIESRVTRRNLLRCDMDGRMFPEAAWMREDLPMCPCHESSGEIYPYQRHQMYFQGGRRARYQPLFHSMAQIPYSGETVRSGYQTHDSHSHLHPTDMRWSSHLPAAGAYYYRGWYSSREPFDSYAANPQVFADSEYYGWGHDTMSDDQRNREQNMSRLPLRRNPQPVQHFQPIGGAAPFITCYQCSELLQLPSDFLLFKGIKIHRVKCSACSSILKFTLEKGSHLVPYTSKSMAPLSADAEKDDVHESMGSSSTFRRSASVSVYTGASQVQNAEKMSLRSSSEAPERQKSKSENNHSQDKGKSIMVEMQNCTAGHSSPGIPRRPKVTWELPAKNNSPLHRLMGYSSPSAVLHGHGSKDSDTQEESRN